MLYDIFICHASEDKDGFVISRFHRVPLRFVVRWRESIRTFGSSAARVRAAVDDLFRTTLAHSA